MTARGCASSAGISGARKGPVDGIAADPIYLDVSVPPGKRKTLPVETRATPSPTSSPAAESSATPRPRLPCRPKPSAGWTRRRRRGRKPLAGPLRPRRRSRRAGRRRRHPLPARLRQAARGTGRLVRPDRDEHAGATAAGVRTAAGRDVPENRKMIGWLGSASSTPPVSTPTDLGNTRREPAARPQPPRSRGLSTPSGECEPGAPAKVRDSKRLHPWLRHLFFPSAAEPLWASASSSTAISKVLAPLVQTAIASIMPIVGCFVACLFQTQTGRSLPGGCFQWPHFAERRRERIPQYQHQVIHFAGEYKNMYVLEADWVRKFRRAAAEPTLLVSGSRDCRVHSPVVRWKVPWNHVETRVSERSAATAD